MSKVVIFGTASFAEVAHFYLTNDSEHEVVAFTVHGARRKSDTFAGLPVVPFETLTETHPPSEYAMFVAVGSTGMNRLRAKIYDEAKALGYTLITYVNSKAIVWTKDVGDNVFIFEANVIQPFVKIGNGVTLWSGNHIGHHSTIGDHCFITSHVVVSGHVKMGAYCFVGVNATFRDDIEVGESSLIGAGTLIMKSTAPHSAYIGQATKPSPFPSDKFFPAAE
jgi:sugar O-acyltransferase (sialic acid O-acetyltransferase NeuD family)